MSTDVQKPGENVVVVQGCRTPFQKSGTGYQDLTSYDLARMAISGVIARSGLAAESVDLVVMGTVISNFQTSNVARDAALAAGIPVSTPAHTVTQACISANQAVTSGADAIRTGRARSVIAGGTESLSDIPIRYRKKFRQKLIESQRYRALTDYFQFLKGLGWRDLLPEIPAIAEFSTGLTMGEDCERLAGRFAASRQEQDEYALRSHRLAAEAAEKGLFDGEVEPVRVPPAFDVVERDNGVRGDTTLEKLASLRPAFVKPYGNVTPGNSSFLTDGAAVVLLMAESTARLAGFEPRVAIHDYVYSAQDPRDSLLLGPAYTTPRILERNGLEASDVDVFEFHEAFAGQIVANLKALDSETFAREQLGRERKVGEIPMDRFNTLGGSLSLGHPFGATGARLVATAANRLVREGGEWALIASCAAGGLGSAILLRRLGENG